MYGPLRCLPLRSLRRLEPACAMCRVSSCSSDHSNIIRNWLSPASSALFFFLSIVIPAFPFRSLFPCSAFMAARMVALTFSSSRVVFSPVHLAGRPHSFASSLPDCVCVCVSVFPCHVLKTSLFLYRYVVNREKKGNSSSCLMCLCSGCLSIRRVVKPVTRPACVSQCTQQNSSDIPSVSFPFDLIFECVTTCALSLPFSS